MATTSETQNRQWLQVAFLVALGALAAASAAWGQLSEPNTPEDLISPIAAESPQVQQTDRVWPPKLIEEINVDPRDAAENKPPDKSIVLIGSASPEHWFNADYAYQVFHWKSPNICHPPLYFEDVGLERYGQNHWGCFDPARTGILFFGNVLALPYNAIVIRPHSVDTPLGFERPGSPAPSNHNYLLYRW